MLLGEFNISFHPVCLIAKVANHFKRSTHNLNNQYLAGMITWSMTLVVSLLTVYFVLAVVNYLMYELTYIIKTIIVYFCLATRGLIQASNKVRKSLDQNDIEGARKDLAMIVGRDSLHLNQEAIITATIETLSENLSDGIIAPMFYYALFGVYGMVAYKVINTLDSMYGYKNETYIHFGFVSAKMDDLVNLIPARLSAILLLFSTVLLRQDSKQAFKIYRRDRYNHTSPNSAHPESVVAGALNIQLGGPNYYFGQLYDKQLIGDSENQPTISMITTVNRLVITSSLLMLIIIFIFKEVV